MSEGPRQSGDRPELGEVALVALCILALLLSAAFLPSLDAFQSGGTGDSDGGGNGDGSDVTGSSSAGGSAGSPLGGSLSTSSRTSIGDTSERPVTSVSRVPLFVVEGVQGSYWRQSAYTEYTGTAWSRSPEWQSLSAGVPNDGLTRDSRSVQYRVELLTASTVLPVTWQPEDARLGGTDAGLEASTVGSIRATRQLPENTTYTARSAPPPQATDTVAGDGPPAVAETYTRLPEETPSRLGELTAEIVRDAETRYERANAVERWLETSKRYSLNVSHTPGEPIADQFIFEMDRGYCQYFATAMTVMLRSQDVPARYVVGFAGGQPVGNDEYLVTSDTAHAWVEVFLSGVGWVTFDPTPAGQIPVETTTPPYNISLDRPAVAGAEVVVSVSKNGSAASSVPVYVNGERAGWTGAEGTVTTRLPYAGQFRIEARQPGTETKYAQRDDPTPLSSGPTAATPPTAGTNAPSAVTAAVAAGSSLRDSNPSPALDESPRIGPSPAVASADGNGSASVVTYDGPTDVTVAVTGHASANGTVTLTATVEDVPVRNGTVRLDGTAVGTTNGSGGATVSLAGVAPGTHTLAVARGNVSGTTELRVTRPDPEGTPPPPTRVGVSVSVPFGLPLPGGPATVNVTRSGHPVQGATVAVDGAVVDETAANGTLAVTLPVSGAVTVRATGPDGTTGETTLPSLARNAAVAAVALVGMVLVVGTLARRFGVTPARLGATASAVLARAVDALLALSTAFVRLGVGIRRGVRRAAARLVSLPRAFAAGGLPLLWRLHPWRLLGALGAWLRRLAASTDRGAVGSSGRRTTRPAEAREDRAGAPQTLRQTWREFTALIGPSRPATRTPGEVARHAVERGFPERPVRTLTAAYRDAEYGSPGDESPSDTSRLKRARAALEAVREATEEGDGE